MRRCSGPSKQKLSVLRSIDCVVFAIEVVRMTGLACRDVGSRLELRYINKTAQIYFSNFYEICPNSKTPRGPGKPTRHWILIGYGVWVLIWPNKIKDNQKIKRTEEIVTMRERVVDSLALSTTVTRGRHAHSRPILTTDF
eukprot:scaffold18507_cov49-Attheya_sp.AAC.5